MSKESLAEGEGFQGGLASPALQEVRSTFIPNVSNLKKPSRPKAFQQVRNRFRMEEIRLYDSPFKELADQVSKN